MENPNLIRRPIVIKGSQVIFGFDKDTLRQTLTSASARRAGTTRPARGRGTASSTRLPRRRPKGFDELTFYAEHFDTVEVNSTFYGQPRPEVTPQVGRAHAARLRVLGQAVPEVHAPADVQGAARRRPAGRRATRIARCSTRWRGRTTPTSTSSAAASTRWRRPAGSARCSRSFRRASRTRRPRATTSPICCARSPAIRSPSSCATAAGATGSARRSRC